MLLFSGLFFIILNEYTSNYVYIYFCFEMKFQSRGCTHALLPLSTSNVFLYTYMYEKSELNSLCGLTSLSRLLRADSALWLFPQPQKPGFTPILLYRRFLPSPSAEMPAAGRALHWREGAGLGRLPPLVAQGLEPVRSPASSPDGPLPLLRGQTHASLRGSVCKA